MRLGIIGPTQCNHVDVGIYIKGLNPDKIITNFSDALIYAHNHNIEFENVKRLLPGPLYSRGGICRDSTQEQLKYISDHSDMLLEFYYNEPHFNDFSCNIPRKLVKVYKNEIPWVDYYSSVEIKKDLYYTEERGDHEYDRHRASLYLFEYEELQECLHDQLRLEIRGSLRNPEINELEYLTIVGVSLEWIKSTLERRFPEIFSNKHIDYTLSYRKGDIDDEIFQFRGYTKCYYEDERINLAEQFEKLNENPDYKDCRFLPYFGTLPDFAKYKK